MTESTLQIIAIAIALVAIALSVHAEYLTRRTEARRRAIRAIEQGSIESSANSESPSGSSEPGVHPASRSRGGSGS